MKYFSILILSLFTVIFGARAQNSITPDAVTVVSYWDNSESHKFACRQTEEKVENGKITKRTTTFNITLSITSATEKAYFLQAVYSNIKSDSLATEEEKFFAKLMENLTVKYKTNELGSIDEILNLEELKKFLLDGYDRTIIKYKSSPAVYERLLKLRDAINTDEMVMKSIEEITLLHFFHGGEYDVKKPMTGAAEFPNLFGGPAFPAQAKIEVSKIAPDKSNFTVTQYTKLDQVEGKPLIIAELKKLFKNLGLDIPPDEELINKLDIKESISSQIITETGWTKMVTRNRTTTVETSSTKVSTVIALLN